LFYLRDESVDDLQKLLNDNDVRFDTEPPEGQVKAEASLQKLGTQRYIRVDPGGSKVPWKPSFGRALISC